MRLGDCGSIWLNQGERDFDCIAVDGDRALIAYTMPAGREFLLEVVNDDHAGSKPVSRNKPPKRWRDAIERRYPVSANCALCKGAKKYLERFQWKHCDNCRN